MRGLRVRYITLRRPLSLFDKRMKNAMTTFVRARLNLFCVNVLLTVCYVCWFGKVKIRHSLLRSQNEILLLQCMQNADVVLLDFWPLAPISYPVSKL